MGNTLKKRFGKEGKFGVMTGLDNAGKTTILYKLKLGEVITSTARIGFSPEKVTYKDINFTVWDIGGDEKIRPLFRHYYEKATSIVFVIDSSNKNRIKSAKKELDLMLKEELLDGVCLLVFANKQDLPNAMSVNKITKKLGLNELSGRRWYVQPCCATTGDGLYEGFDWLCNTLKANH